MEKCQPKTMRLIACFSSIDFRRKLYNLRQFGEIWIQFCHRVFFILPTQKKRQVHTVKDGSITNRVDRDPGRHKRREWLSIITQYRQSRRIAPISPLNAQLTIVKKASIQIALLIIRLLRKILLNILRQCRSYKVF